ncbi:MAG: ATP-binding cassette domain-containing protein, partial [Pseudomonadota bacterium]|nr:ATP-binding cassette domain-containing protein [Pseudomonadota bacterium]
ADEVLARVGLAHVADAYPAALSGGMQQRLAIAQALAGRPRVLLHDEPFGALDPGTRAAMHVFLQELRAETGMTVFMVSHDLEEAFKLGDRVLVFDKPRWDPIEPEAYGATITYDFDARDGGIPFQAAAAAERARHVTEEEDDHVPAS